MDFVSNEHRSSSDSAVSIRSSCRQSRSANVESIFQSRDSFTALGAQSVLHQSVVLSHPTSLSSPVRSPTPRIRSPVQDGNSVIEREVERLKQEVAFRKAVKQHRVVLQESDDTLQSQLVQEDPFGRQLAHLPSEIRTEGQREWSTPSPTITQKHQRNSLLSRSSLSIFGFSLKLEDGPSSERSSPISRFASSIPLISRPERRTMDSHRSRSRSLPPVERLQRPATTKDEPAQTEVILIAPKPSLEVHEETAPRSSLSQNYEDVPFVEGQGTPSSISTPLSGTTRQSRSLSRRASRYPHEIVTPSHDRIRPIPSPKLPRSASHRQRRYSSQRFSIQQSQSRRKALNSANSLSPSTPYSPAIPRTPSTPTTPMSPPAVRRMLIDRRRKRMMKLVKTLGEEVPISLIDGADGAEGVAPLLESVTTLYQVPFKRVSGHRDENGNANSHMSSNSSLPSNKRVVGSRPLPQPLICTLPNSPIVSPSTSSVAHSPLQWNSSEPTMQTLVKKRSFLRKRRDKDASAVVIPSEASQDSRHSSPGSVTSSPATEKTPGGGLRRKMSLSRLFLGSESSSSPISPSAKTKLGHSRNLPVPPLPFQLSSSVISHPIIEASVTPAVSPTTSRSSTAKERGVLPPRVAQSLPTSPVSRHGRSFSQSRNVPVSLTVIPPLPKQSDIEIVVNDDDNLPCGAHGAESQKESKHKLISRLPSAFDGSPAGTSLSSGSTYSSSDNGGGSWEDVSGDGTVMAKIPSGKPRGVEGKANARHELGQLALESQVSAESLSSNNAHPNIGQTTNGTPRSLNPPRRVGSLGRHARTRSKSLNSPPISPYSNPSSDANAQPSPSLSRSRTLSATSSTHRRPTKPEVTLHSPISAASWMSFGQIPPSTASPSISSPIFGHANPRSLEGRDRRQSSSAGDVQSTDAQRPIKDKQRQVKIEDSRLSSEPPPSNGFLTPDSVGRTHKRNRISGLQGLVGKGSTKRKETRQGWSGEWNQTDIRDVIHKLRNIK